MFRALISLAVGLGLGLFVAGMLPDKTAGLAARRLVLLEQENQRLRLLVEQAEKAKALARTKDQREAVERAVVAIRGLAFKTPVQYEMLDRKQIKATIAGKLDEVFSPREFEDIGSAFARLGLLPDKFPLRQKYIDLLGEQVAAFYDQHSHKLVMFEDASLDNTQNQIVLAHELTHALQDQHFSLARLPLEIKTNDDRAAAASALCEGDATLVMTEFMLQSFSLNTLKDSASSLTQDMQQLASAPRYLREMLLFPYLRGQEFCSVLHAQGGYQALNAAYANPPASTSQILDSQKFTVRQDPLPILWDNLSANDQTPIVDNVLGEMGLRILLGQWLDDPSAEKISQGWRADRYLCYSAGDALVWKSSWASAEQADAFADAMTRVFAKRYPEGGRVLRSLRPRPLEVVLIDASSPSWAQSLQDQFAR